MGEYAESQEYQSFRSNIPQRKICVRDNETWTIYDAGPRSVRCPLIFLPPVSGQADIFFKQLLALSSMGYRVISVEYPVVWTVDEFCKSLRRLVDHLHLDKVHLFGASLGGYLAQKFAEHTSLSPYVHSMVLCNAFIDTTVFRKTITVTTFWMLPALVLKKMVMGTFNRGLVDSRTASSIDFMVESLERLSQQELASRLTLNCVEDYVQPQKLQNIPVTIMDVNDDSALSSMVKEEVCKCYPDARRAHLKNGGNFPYLSRPEEVDLFLQIHLQQFIGTKYTAIESNSDVGRLHRAADSDTEEVGKDSADHSIPQA